MLSEMLFFFFRRMLQVLRLNFKTLNLLHCIYCNLFSSYDPIELQIVLKSRFICKFIVEAWKFVKTFEIDRFKSTRVFSLIHLRKFNKPLVMINTRWESWLLFSSIYVSVNIYCYCYLSGSLLSLSRVSLTHCICWLWC